MEEPPASRPNILRPQLIPPIPFPPLNLVHIHVVQHPDRNRPTVQLAVAELAHALGQRGDLSVGQLRIRLRVDVHAAGAAKDLAPDAVAEGVIDELVLGLFAVVGGNMDGELRDGGVEEGVVALGSVSV